MPFLYPSEFDPEIATITEGLVERGLAGAVSYHQNIVLSFENTISTVLFI